MDAEPAPFNDTAARVAPEHEDAWLRLDGVWVRTWVRHWYRQDGRWVVFVLHEWPNGRPWTDAGAFWYSPATLMKRVEGEPPPPPG